MLLQYYYYYVNRIGSRGRETSVIRYRVGAREECARDNSVIIFLLHPFSPGGYFTIVDRSNITIIAT